MVFYTPVYAGAVSIDSALSYGTANYQSNPEGAKTVCLEAAERAISQNDYYNAARCYKLSGLAFWVASNHYSAMVCFRKAETLAIKSDSLDLLAGCRSYLARLHTALQQDDSAIFYYLKIIPYYESHQRYNDLAKTYAEIGKVYIYLNELDKALNYQNKCLELLDKHNILDPRLKGSTHNSVGYIHDELNNYSKAIEHYEQSLLYRAEAGDELGKLTTQTNLCVAYRNEGKDEKAYRCNVEVLDLSRQLGASELEAVNLLNIGINLSDLEKYRESLQYLDTAKDLLIEENDYPNLRELEGMYSFNYEKLGMYDEALAHFKLHKQWADSVVNSEKFRAVEELRTHFESERKEQQNALLTETTKRQALEINQKRSWIIGLITAAILAVFILGLSMNRVRLKSRVELAEKERMNQSAVALAQMASTEQERKRIAKELHDGIGQQLTAMSMQAQTNDTPENLKALISDTAEDVRNLSHSIMPRALSKLSLNQALEELCLMSSNPSINVSFVGVSNDTKFSEEVQLNAYRIAQEAINNALKHSGCTSIKVSLEHLTDSYKMAIQDNGKGIQKHSNPGIGMNTMKLRAEKINALLNVTNQIEGGTVVELTWR